MTPRPSLPGLKLPSRTLGEARNEHPLKAWAAAAGSLSFPPVNDRVPTMLAVLGGLVLAAGLAALIAVPETDDRIAMGIAVVGLVVFGLGVRLLRR